MDNQSEVQPSSGINSGIPSLPLPGHIFFDEKASGIYGRYVKRTFVKDGKIYHVYENLGRVLDKDKGVFRNRERGVYTFNLRDGYGIVDSPPNPAVYDIPKHLTLHFGDAWMVDQIMKQSGLEEVLNNLIPEASNTLKALISFRLSEPHSYYNTEEWYRKSYARVLYPNANLDSSQISKFHVRIGEESIYREFFKSYLQIITKNRSLNEQISIPILIDSTGIPNDIDISLTAINNHNGVISNEIRMIYIVDKDTTLPIFFRIVPGNIVDNSTLINTINLLLTYGINIAIVIIDADYSSENNIRQLIEAKIPFVTRMTKNRKNIRNLYLNMVKI
jgi:transposase